MADKKTTHHITRAPKAFQAIAAKHNSLAKAHAGLEAGYGIVVQKSQGNTRISVIPSAIADIAGQVLAGAPLNELHFDDGTITIDIDSGGVIMNFTGTSTSVQMSSATGSLRMINSSGKVIDLQPEDTAHNMFFTDIAVCDSGTPKTMTILGCTPF